MKIARTHFLAIKLCLVLAMLGSTDTETTLKICRYPEKGSTCTLTCLSPNKLNVLFMKTNGSLSGEGGCLIATGCKSNNKRYKVSQDLNGTYLQITNLNRTEDGVKWHCEHGNEKSTLKQLTVYRILADKTILFDYSDSSGHKKINSMTHQTTDEKKRFRRVTNRVTHLPHSTDDHVETGEESDSN